MAAPKIIIAAIQIINTTFSVTVPDGKSSSAPRNPRNLSRTRMKNPIATRTINKDPPKAIKVKKVSSSAVKIFIVNRIA